MDEISLLGKVARRLHIGKAICKILLPFAGAFLRDGELESEKVLASVSPDIGKSCIRQDMLKIVPKYDLQVVIPAYNAGRYIERCVDSMTLCSGRSE